MLVKEFGCLENAPPVIKARIVDIESVSMTEVNIFSQFKFLRFC